jgi:glycerophosphoryl diester phosphodiesterase
MSRSVSSASGLPAQGMLTINRPVVIAHRGFSHLAPENTLVSFRLAIAAGTNLVELDVRETKDGQLIVFHDRELDRTTDARHRWRKKHIPVSARTAAEIQTLDAGSWFDEQYAGTQVPLLAQTLDAMKSSTLTLIERKSGDPLTLLKLLRNKALLAHVIVQSFDWAFLRQLHELEPELIIAALGPPERLLNGKRRRSILRKLTAQGVMAAQKTGAKVVVWNQQISKRAVRLAHSRGLKVWAYTIDHPKVASRLLKLGVNGLITNNPPLILKTIARGSESRL